jgi:hypothetical protein
MLKYVDTKSLLKQVAGAIRKYRPDIVLIVNPGTGHASQRARYHAHRYQPVCVVRSEGGISESSGAFFWMGRYCGYVEGPTWLTEKIAEPQSVD